MNVRHAVVIAAGFLVSFTAAVHLVLGLDGIVAWSGGGEFDVLAPLFLVSSLALFGAMYAFAKGLVAPTTTYLFVAGVTSLHLVGYADWHAFGTAESVLGLDGAHDHGTHGHDTDGHGLHDHTTDGHGHPPDATPSDVLLDHLRSDMTALSTKVAETLATGTLLALAVTED